uniref:Uncharacterized protein n=1 Tax=Arundo donax TaxID=35708 RepID=A0A0A9EY67_ARUDO
MGNNVQILWQRFQNWLTMMPPTSTLVRAYMWVIGSRGNH